MFAWIYYEKVTSNYISYKAYRRTIGHIVLGIMKAYARGHMITLRLRAVLNPPPGVVVYIYRHNERQKKNIYYDKGCANTTLCE